MLASKFCLVQLEDAYTYMTIQQKEKCMTLYVKYNSVMQVQSEIQGSSAQGMKPWHCCQGTGMHYRIHGPHTTPAVISLHFILMVPAKYWQSLYYLYYHTTPYQHLYDVSHLWYPSMVRITTECSVMLVPPHNELPLKLIVHMHNTCFSYSTMHFAFTLFIAFFVYSCQSNYITRNSVSSHVLCISGPLSSGLC
jgi:hypothetical protein